MRMPIINNGPMGVTDRIAGAAIAMTLVFATLILLPVIISFKVHGTHTIPVFFPFGSVQRIFSVPFFIWAIIVSFLSAIYGVIAGSMGVLVKLSHLWGTSCDTRETQKLWAILILGSALSFCIFNFGISTAQ